MFELYEEKVELVDRAGNKNTYTISPLPGEYLEDLYYVIDKFQSAGEKDSEILKALTTDTSNKLHKLVMATLLQSYPNEDKDKLNKFVSQNLLKFVEPIIKVNMPSA